MSRLRVDWEVARRGYRRYAAYPAAVAAGVFTNTVFGFVKGYILLAVLADQPVVGRLRPRRRAHVHVAGAGADDAGDDDGGVERHRAAHPVRRHRH